jgi:16S rRNA processing protein RimM
VVIGRIAGFRGTRGELTVRVASGIAARWTELRHVGLRRTPEPGDEASFTVESARAYGDRLVLKLAGIDGASAAADLSGRFVIAPADEVPELPAGTYYAARLVGLPVLDEAGRMLGRIDDIVATGGTDVLVVVTHDGAEILIPFARELMVAIDPERVVVRMPEGLGSLNDGAETGH